MVRRCAGMCWLIWFCLTGAAAPPAGSQSASQATPKAAAFAFVRAMEANDLDAFKSVTIGSEEDYKLFEPLLNMVGAAKQMEKAARERFGKEGRLVVRNSPAMEMEVHIQESDVKVTGDTAILRRKGDEDADPLTAKKTEAGWKVDLTGIPNKQGMQAAAPAMQKMQHALEQCAADIRAGKFKTAQEAEKAVVQRMAEAAASGR